jgi:hypothetical protein
MRSQATEIPVGDHVRALRERGYTVFDQVFDEAEVDRLASTMARLHDEAGRPSCYAREPKRLSPEVELCQAGLVFYKFIKRCPDHADLIVRPSIVAAMRGYLGEDMSLELTGGVVVDSSRPFFAWHTHVGGIDDGRYRREGVPLHLSEPQRVMSLLYVDDIEDDNGPILIYPRTVADPTPAPHDPLSFDWPGQTVLKVRRGSVLLLDQCTWHAVRAKTTPGLRSFIGCYFRSSNAPPTDLVDDSLPGFQGGDALLQSILPRSRG